MSSRLASFVVVLTAAVAAQAQIDYGYHSSTYEEGVQRGFADVVRSQGMANLMNSKAATEYEQARREYLDNRLKATQTYFEMRRYNEESRRSERGSPLSMDQYVRLARQMAPESLSPSQLDPLTGAINWPGNLRQAEYQSFRQRVEKLFQDRAAGYVDSTALRASIEHFQAQLKADLPKFAANDYLAAKKFLDSLAVAARTVQG